jgi:hypothetical protein
MSGGEISGNTAFADGGGVDVWDGTFTMNGGNIYGTDTPSRTNTANGTAPNGAAVYVNGGTANYGGSYGNGTITTTDNTLPPIVFPNPITTAAEWNTEIGMIQAAPTGSYTLNIQGNIGVAGSTAASFGTTPAGNPLTVTLQGSGKLYLTGPGNMLCIDADQTLVIDSANLTLQGLTNGQNGALQDNNNTTVSVAAGGTLELKNGTISGNTSPGNGGGVSVRGTFTMSGGKISGNIASDTNAGIGGGVCVNNSGTFAMSGGDISGNTAPAWGGGVGVNVGTFRIVTGTIYGNESTVSPATLKNTATTGAALYKSSGTAEYGNGTAWNALPLTASGSDSYTDNTIKYLNGVLQ